MRQLSFLFDLSNQSYYKQNSPAQIRAGLFLNYVIA